MVKRANPPERINIRSISRVLFAGPSALLLPNGTLRCGDAADVALRASRLEVAHEHAQRHDDGAGHEHARDGLLLIHSHRQRGEDFALVARMLHLIDSLPVGSHTSHGVPEGQPQSVLHGLSLLLVNNDAVHQSSNHTSPDHPVNWLRRFTQPTLRLRMLVLTAVNFGYTCGGFHALAALSGILPLFPWVICTSGPDALLTPWGAFRLSAMLTASGNHRGNSTVRPDPMAVAEVHAHADGAPGRHSRRIAKAATHGHALLADFFGGAKSQLSLDLFVYEPPRSPNTRTPRPRVASPAMGASTGASMGASMGARMGASMGAPVEADRFADAESTVHHFWADLVEGCLQAVSTSRRMPEPLLLTAANAAHVRVSSIGATTNCFGFSRPCQDWAKLHATQPLRHAAVWHSHNATLVRRWVAEQERLWRVTPPSLADIAAQRTGAHSTEACPG